jgi:hypothetical protein
MVQTFFNRIDFTDCILRITIRPYIEQYVTSVVAYAIGAICGVALAIYGLLKYLKGEGKALGD